MFKYELHAHCSEVSRCGRSTALEMAKAFKSVGFSGMVFTDHFIYGNTNIPHSGKWEDRMKMIFDSYKEAEEFGRKNDFLVMPGIEHHYGHGKEVLVYGNITFEALAAHSEIETMNIKEFCTLCHNLGWFVSQAHPFRERDYIEPGIAINTGILDGIEVYNHCNNSKENKKAVLLCAKEDLIPTSGSDTHDSALCGKAGIALDFKISNGHELARALFERKAKIIVDGKVI